MTEIIDRTFIKWDDRTKLIWYYKLELSDLILQTWIIWSDITNLNYFSCALGHVMLKNGSGLTDSTQLNYVSLFIKSGPT